MKLAVATQSGGLDDIVSPTFGRAPTFTMVNVEDEEIKGTDVIQNQYAGAPGGAGIQAAGFVANQGVKAVVAGNFGPNAVGVLNQSGVEVVQASGMKVRDAAQRYLDGELTSTSQATAPPGMGMGMGRGIMQQPMQPPQQPPQQPAQPISKEQELQMLENQASMIENQLEQIRKRIKEIEKRK